MIETKNLTFSYPDGTKALDEVSIIIEKGSFTCFLGLNGAGKSTLLQHFNGLLEPTSGKVIVDREGIDRKTAKNVRQKVGMVFQNPEDQLFEATVGDDVAYGPRNLKLSEAEIEKRVKESLEIVAMKGAVDTPIDHLSTGQKKRVAVAGVLAMEPDVLVFDEPISNLDPSGGDALVGLMEELKAMGKTIVVATHNVELAYRWSDYVYILKGGRVLEEGTPVEVFTQGSLLKRAGLRQPQVLKMYSALKSRGLANGKVPRDLLDIMDGLPKKAPHMNGVGRIYVSGPLDQSDPITPDVQFLGILGTKAKLAARDAGLEADFYSDVVNNCLLKAVSGFDCLISASEAMIDTVKERVTRYNEESGLDIKIEIFNR